MEKSYIPSNDIIQAWLLKAAHDLGYLLNLIGTRDDSLDHYYDRVDRVSRFAVQMRYPDQIIKLKKNRSGRQLS
jgi:hypothetical protein